MTKAWKENRYVSSKHSFIAHKEKNAKRVFKAANVQDWHRHDSFLKTMSLNTDMGSGRGLFPPEMQKIHYGSCVFLEEVH